MLDTAFTHDTLSENGRTQAMQAHVLNRSGSVPSQQACNKALNLQRQLTFSTSVDPADLTVSAEKMPT
jgi:meiotically up-regulated gene 157 (Mug157) protein